MILALHILFGVLAFEWIVALPLAVILGRAIDRHGPPDDVDIMLDPSLAEWG